LLDPEDFLKHCGALLTTRELVQEIGGYYRMALSYFFYVTNSGNPSHSSYWPNEQAGCNNKSLQGFLNNNRESFFGNLLATVYSTCNSHHRFLLKSKCISAYKLNMEILILRLVLCLIGALFYFVVIVRVISKVMACWA
jgi:hypothetical protein